MVLTITSAFSLFLLISLSTVIFFAAKRFKLPYTVLLVLVGLLLVPIVNLPYFENVFGFIDDMVLTPELLFYIFLPVLIFESGFNMNIRKMLDSAWTISFLAIFALSLSVIIIASLLYFTMPLIGIQMPFIMALLFGAIISPTDPVAVLSIFKEVGVPPKLAMIFEGESLFNDGTAMALFIVILSIGFNGFHGTETVLHGAIDFALMIILGIVIGLVMAAFFSRAARFTQKNEFVTVTLLLISAHIVFISTEFINESGIVHVSSIIATTVSSLFLGNYARNTLSPQIDDYLGKLIEHVAFVVNSLVFLMAGLLFASSGVNFAELWMPILMAVLIVAFARAVSTYTVLVPLNISGLERKIPSSWRKLLAWGSLRGALSIIIVLLIPENFTIDGWLFDSSPRDFLLALTIGCILATLFIKAPMIVPITRRYKLNESEPLKDAHAADLSIYYLLKELSQLEGYKLKKFMNDKQFDSVKAEVEVSLKSAIEHRQELINEFGKKIFDQSLHLAMVHVEKVTLKKLFMNEEVSEKTYRKIYSKLSLQQEKIELAQHENIDPKAYSDRKDIFDRLVRFVFSPFEKETEESLLIQRLELYRAQMIMARKAVLIIERMQTNFGSEVFLEKSYEEVSALYRRYMERCAFKAENLLEENKEALSGHVELYAKRALAASGERALSYLRENGLTDEHMEEDIIEICTNKRALS